MIRNTLHTQSLPNKESAYFSTIRQILPIYNSSVHFSTESEIWRYDDS